MVIKKRSNRYYTPDISEFIEGFKYQEEIETGYIIINFGDVDEKEKMSEIKRSKYWSNMETPSLETKEITYPYTMAGPDGMKITVMNDSGMYQDSFEDRYIKRIEGLLKNNAIRADVNGGKGLKSEYPDTFKRT